MNKTDAVYQAYCKTKFPLPKEKEIAALEHQLSLRFPRTYRAFLKAFNGSFFCHPVIAFPEPITVKWRDKMVTHVDDELLGMNGLNATIASYELGDESDVTLFDNKHPIHLLVIGHTMTGSLLLLDMASGHESEILIKLPDEYAYKIADDIDGFCELIQLPAGSS